MDIEAGPLLTIVLLFLLIVGVAVIYHEEILESEILARTYDPMIPDIVFSAPTVVDNPPGTPIAPGTPSPEAPPIPETYPAVSAPPVSVESFTGSQRVQFGSSRIVDTEANDIANDNIAAQTRPPLALPLHTVGSGVNKYYLRGVLDMIQRNYRPSPHGGKIIFLDRTDNIRESRPEYEYFILSVADTTPEPIDITGWKVFDQRGKTSYEIPNGKRLFGSLDTVNQPIRVHGGDIIIVSSGRSPTGFSFRINKCSGFRSQFKQFIPSIKTKCPNPIDEFIADGTTPYTDDRCYEAVRSLRECETVTELPSGVTVACRRFLENSMNEGGCIDLHRNDPDFFVSEWRVFLGSDRPLWRDRDRNILYLVDENDLLVATLLYN